MIAAAPPTCPKCETPIRAKAEHLGTTIRCPKCRTPIALPPAATPSKPMNWKQWAIIGVTAYVVLHIVYFDFLAIGFMLEVRKAQASHGPEWDKQQQEVIESNKEIERWNNEQRRLEQKRR